jgi:murein L,D-transpeptidase YafK
MWFGRRVLGVVALAVATAAGPAAPAAASAGSPNGVADSAALKADRVVVFKNERKLVLMRGEAVMRVYDVALGGAPKGHKLADGDQRTPEGSYVLDYRLPRSAYHKAIHISYPNDEDAARAAALGLNPGGRIMIHGLPNRASARRVNHPKLDWTQGCIAVTNREMDEIWAAVDDGTPIEIYP